MSRSKLKNLLVKVSLLAILALLGYSLTSILVPLHENVEGLAWDGWLLVLGKGYVAAFVITAMLYFISYRFLEKTRIVGQFFWGLAVGLCIQLVLTFHDYGTFGVHQSIWIVIPEFIVSTVFLPFVLAWLLSRFFPLGLNDR